MDSGLLQKDSCNISEDEEEEFYSIRTRQRTAAKQIKRKDVSTRKTANEIEPHVENALLGENGLGLTAEEFSALPDSERKQLMAAVLLSKEEYNKQKNKIKSGQFDEHTETPANKMTVNSMPAKLECSIQLPVVIVDAAVVQKYSPAPSLNKFRFKRLSEVAAEGKMHTETVECKVNEDYDVVESEANVPKLISRDDYSSIGTEKFKLSAVKPVVGETYSPKKNEDSGLRRKSSTQDCLVVHKSNPPDSLTCGNNVQPRTRSGDIFSNERETSRRCLSLANYDKRRMCTIDASATLRKAKTTEENYLDCPDSPTSCELVRKYHIQATDMRPLFKQRGLDLQTRVRLIYDYYTDCELRLYKSYSEINSRTQWGKPVAIEVDKGRVSTRNRRAREVVTETEQMNDRSPHKNESQALDSLVYSTCNTESEEVNKRMVLAEHCDFVEQFPSSTATRKALDVSVVLDNQCTREDIETRLRRSRQTKIGGGLVEDEGTKISRRKLPMCESLSTASDNENDPDFTPEKKKKRIHVANERSDKRKKRRLDVVKSKGKHSRKTKEQMSECSKASEGNKVDSDEYDGETQESRNLANSSSWQSVGKCQGLAMPKTNGNNSNIHSSSSSEDFYETSSTTVSRVEERKSVNDTLMNSSPVNHGVLNGCQINAELEDVLSSSPVFGRNSSLKDDTKLQVFPVFQKLVRPSIRENEGNTDTRNIPSTSKNSNLMQNEDNEEYLSGDSSEGDDCNLDKSTKKRKKNRGQPPAFAKTYQKRKIKNAADQQTIISYATPSFKIPKLTQMCPLCQKDFPLSSLEEHVQKCVQLDDEKKT